MYVADLECRPKCLCKTLFMKDAVEDLLVCGLRKVKSASSGCFRSLGLEAQQYLVSKYSRGRRYGKRKAKYFVLMVLNV